MSFNTALRSSKGYRNPDFMQQAVAVQEIDEIGSCFPKHIFDPHGLPEEDYYLELGGGDGDGVEDGAGLGDVCWGWGWDLGWDWDRDRDRDGVEDGARVGRGDGDRDGVGKRVGMGMRIRLGIRLAGVGGGMGWLKAGRWEEDLSVWTDGKSPRCCRRDLDV